MDDKKSCEELVREELTKLGYDTDLLSPLMIAGIRYYCLFGIPAQSIADMVVVDDLLSQVLKKLRERGVEPNTTELHDLRGKLSQTRSVRDALKAIYPGRDWGPK